MTSAQGSGTPPGLVLDGQRFFENETFGGNGRTCLTCHSKDTGTVSPEDAQKRFEKDPNDVLFRHDGSDNGHGGGVSRMLADATVLVTIKAAGAIVDHAQAAAPPMSVRQAIAAFQKTNGFFTSPELRRFALERGPAPTLPEGRTESEKRGRRFF